ncbi:MAG: flagellar assembly protein FliW [Alphaproteobacteria bacterium]|uniref:Flagellar assembly factor FliW n=1 Tax=Candidatus Nitrobium versatile TaxID=2884831 RepID=A0A953J8N2_9BACT|nr:flagellar assembly protein FliW [Candidatus Nitrobium versatile]
MKINTTRFGEVEVGEDSFITFPMGIPGFLDLKRFFIIEYRDSIKWLQAVDDADIAFIVTDPFPLFPDYSLTIKDDVEQFLQIRNPGDVIVMVILTVSDNKVTANLRAPLIVNASNKRAFQMLLDDERYSFRVPLPSSVKESDRETAASA